MDTQLVAELREQVKKLECEIERLNSIIEGKVKSVQLTQKLDEDEKKPNELGAELPAGPAESVAMKKPNDHLTQKLDEDKKKPNELGAELPASPAESDAMKKRNDLGAELPAGPAESVAKKRKCGYWPGWKVKMLGRWDGFEIINTGGGLEWLQASIGSEFWTYHHGKFFHMKVKPGIHPSAWDEVIEVPDQPYDADLKEYEVVPPYIASTSE